MENENGNQKELINAYQQVLQQNQELRYRIQALQLDKVDARMNTLMHIMENKDMYSEKIIKLAEWHIRELLAKPKNNK